MLQTRLVVPTRRTVLRSIRRQRQYNSAARASPNGGTILAAGASAAILLSSHQELVKRQPTLLQGADDMYMNVHYDDYEAGTLTRMGQDFVTNLKDFTRQLKISLRDASIMLSDKESTAVSDKHHSSTQEHNDELVRNNKLLFPTLDVNIMVHNSDAPPQAAERKFLLNTNDGIPFENDLFKGKVLLVLKPSKGGDDNDSPYNERLFSKDIRFEIQIQGRFKYIPSGTLYCGGELVSNEPMNLSRTTRGAAQVMLSLLSRIIGSDMQYSFGGGGERPHISFPLETAMDTIVVTTEDERSPPCLGQAIADVESTNGNTNLDNTINLEDTYTMTFQSTCIDLPTWSIVKPFPVNLSNFWGDSLMRLVVYEQQQQQQQEGREEKITMHKEVVNESRGSDNNYLFVLQFEHLKQDDDMDCCVGLNEDNVVKERVPLFGLAPQWSL